MIEKYIEVTKVALRTNQYKAYHKILKTKLNDLLRIYNFDK